MSAEIGKYPRLELIVACEQDLGIGKDQKLPWNIPSEFKYFLSMTQNRKNSEGKVHASIFGRNNWDSVVNYVSSNGKSPWDDTICFILSRTMSPQQLREDVYVCSNLQEVIDHLNRPEIKERVDRVWVHGGSAIYAEALRSPYFYRLYFTKIKASYPSDVFFPRFDENRLSLVHDPDVPQGIQHDAGVDYQVCVFQSTGVSPLD